MLENLKESLLKAPIVKKKEYNYFVHPITDGVPLVEPNLIEEVVEVISRKINHDVDKIVCIEAMGIPIATALSLKTGIPFVVVRKRTYGLEGEVDVHQITGYSNGKLYINGIKRGERVILVDDVVSTGGTLTAVINALKSIGAEIIDVIVVIEKGEGKSIVERKARIKIKSLLKVNVKDNKVVIEGEI
ncbi:MAG: hypoxanthine/guanine phosphoribosyltransferase [Methanobacterium sp.]